MAKKKIKNRGTMASKPSGSGEEGTQLDLIDVGPEHSEELNELTTAWKSIVTKRLALQAKEAVAKDKALALFKAENLSRLEDGSIKCRCEGWKLELKPSEEKFTATRISE